MVLSTETPRAQRPASPARRVGLRAAAALLALCTILGCGQSLTPWLHTPTLPRDITVPSLEESLGRVDIVGSRPDAPGYRREEFGPGWAERGGGCTTRQVIIAAQLEGVRAGGERCRLLEGRGIDPYSGAELSVAGDAIEVDHVFPLSAAWDMGASRWDATTRAQFANDQVNLVATSKAENREKLDQLPARWMPSSAVTRCWYAERLAAVAARWRLALTTEDARVMRRSCRTHALVDGLIGPVRLVLGN